MPKYKLTNEQIEEISRDYQLQGASNKRVDGSTRSLAAKYGVGLQAIRNAIRGITKPKQTVMERFMKYVRKTDSGCWLWTGGIDKDGYGEFGWPAEGIKKAHHASYKLFKGDLPVGKPQRLHSCDVRSCVNPDHLFPGTARENIDDMLQKGRSLKGERNPQSKLAWKDVREIRASYIRYPSGRPENVTERCKNSQRYLAEKYGVSRAVIKSILKNKTWKEMDVQKP